MSTSRDSQFGIQISNVPIINIRFEFNDLLGLFRSTLFRQQFRGHAGTPILVKTHYFAWFGRPEILLTHLLRQAIVGLESAVSSAVFLEALTRGTITPQIIEAAKNPHSLRGRGTAECVYNALPRQIDISFALADRNCELWARTQIFYRELRNPLFHSFEISNDDPDPVWRALEFLWELFQWLNSWHSTDLLLDGPIQWSPGIRERITTIFTPADEHVKQLIKNL